MKFDLNCDMGESYGAWTMGFDAEAMPLVTSVNIACGFHASDPVNMARTVALAKKHGVAVGAHPGYHDLVGFGRRQIAQSREEIKADVMYQIGALLAFCGSDKVPLQHVKAHGALYNLAATDQGVASAIAEAIKAVDPSLFMLCLANSAMTAAAREAGIPYMEEAFADRAYASDGSLVPRGRPGALILDADIIAERVLLMAREKKAIAIDGREIRVDAGTVCVHGDTPGAVSIIRAVRSRLEEEGIELTAFGGDRGRTAWNQS
jgi:UPF0271 protein